MRYSETVLASFEVHVPSEGPMVEIPEGSKPTPPTGKVVSLLVEVVGANGKGANNLRVVGRFDISKRVYEANAEFALGYHTREFLAEQCLEVANYEPPYGSRKGMFRYMVRNTANDPRFSGGFDALPHDGVGRRKSDVRHVVVGRFVLIFREKIGEILRHPEVVSRHNAWLLREAEGRSEDADHAARQAISIRDYVHHTTE